MYSSILPITNSYGRVFKCDQNYNAIAQIVNQTNSKRNSQKEKRSQFASGNWVFDWGTKVACRLPLVWRWGRSQLMSVWRPVGLEWGQNSLQKQWLAYQSEIVFFLIDPLDAFYKYHDYITFYMSLQHIPIHDMSMSVFKSKRCYHQSRIEYK